jgi:molybdopterin synthase catalytic subunit
MDADSQDWIAIEAQPLDPGRAVDFVRDPAAGGIDLFIGTTRGEERADGVKLAALDYEAYQQMALEQMHDLAGRARGRWPIVKLALLHRIGRVEPAQPSIIIAISTPHRADAFAACRFLIDTLKQELAIWKKEIWADGSGSWSGR